MAQTEQKEINLSLGNLSINNSTQRTIAIIGGKGTGKTQTLKMLFLNSPLPCVLFDTLNVVPDMKDCHRIIINRKNKDEGNKLGLILNKMKYKKVIISLIDYNQEEGSKFIDGIFTTWKPHDLLIFVDEVHEITPERGMSQEYSTEFERAVRHYRNKNVGFIINTQRPAFTSKKVLGLIDFLILFRVTYPNDIRVVKELISGMLPEQTESIISQIQTKGFLEGYAIDFIPQQEKKSGTDKLIDAAIILPIIPP